MIWLILFLIGLYQIRFPEGYLFYTSPDRSRGGHFLGSLNLFSWTESVTSRGNSASNETALCHAR